MVANRQERQIAAYYLYGAPWVQEQRSAGEIGAGWLEVAFHANRMVANVESAQESLAEYDRV